MPSYEWTTLAPGASVPPGLEVQLPVDGSGLRTARIPLSWRLLVVAQPLNEGCRVDVTRRTTLAQVREAVAEALAGGQVARVESLSADALLLAGLAAGEGGWARTVEEATLFGKRVTCQLFSGLASRVEIQGQIAALEARIAEVERALRMGEVAPGAAHAELAQVEAALERVQCRGIDAAETGGLEEARQQRRELTRHVELLSTRLHGLFVGLDVARRLDRDRAAPASAPAPAAVPPVTPRAAGTGPLMQVTVPVGLGPGAVLQVTAPDGAAMHVTVPEGVAGGQPLAVQF